MKCRNSSARICAEFFILVACIPKTTLFFISKIIQVRLWKINVKHSRIFESSQFKLCNWNLNSNIFGGKHRVSEPIWKSELSIITLIILKSHSHKLVFTVVMFSHFLSYWRCSYFEFSFFSCSFQNFWNIFLVIFVSSLRKNFRIENLISASLK